MCTVLLPPCVIPIAIDKYIISSRQARTLLWIANTTSKTGEHAVAQLVVALHYKPVRFPMVSL